MVTQDRPGFIASLKKDAVFDMVMLWVSAGPLMFCGEIQEIDKEKKFVEIRTFAEETVTLPITEKVTIMEDIDKKRFLDIKIHMRGKEVSGEVK